MDISLIKTSLLKGILAEDTEKENVPPYPTFQKKSVWKRKVVDPDSILRDITHKSVATEGMKQIGLSGNQKQVHCRV